MSVYAGHKKKFESLKSSGADERAFLDFVHAAEMGHINIVKAYVDVFGQARINDKRKSSAGQSAFFLSATFQHDAVSRYLLRNGADVNTQDDHGFTPFLCLAIRARAGHPDCHKTLYFLLDEGADPDITNKKGQRAIDFLKSNDQLWMYAINPKARRHARLALRRSIFSKMCERNEIDKVSAYLEKYPEDAHYRWEDHKTCLMYALDGQAYETAMLLIKSGADVNAMLKIGNTLLMTAVMNKDVTAVELLLKNGADYRIVGAHGASVYGILKQELLLASGFEKKIFEKIKDLLDQARKADFEEAVKDRFDKGTQAEIPIKRMRLKKRDVHRDLKPNEPKG